MAEGRAQHAGEDEDHTQADQAHDDEEDDRIVEIDRSHAWPNDSAEAGFAAGQRRPAKCDGKG